MKSIRVLAIICAFSVLIACDSSKPQIDGPIAIDQETFCFAVDLDAALISKFCKVGQKVLFNPVQWGNEQFPVRFAAKYCDLRYSVVITTGAVSCIYKPAEMKIPDNSTIKP